MDLDQVLNRRRAYRALEDVEITQEMIEELAEAAALAPSCFNHQPWRFVFVHAREKLEKIFTAMARGNEWTQKASLIIAVCSAEDLDCVIKGRSYYLFDTGLATAQLILKATAMGLVAHPIAGYKENVVKELLCIPEEMTVITLVVVGKHTKEGIGHLSAEQQKSEEQRPPRLPREAFAWDNRYSVEKEQREE